MADRKQFLSATKADQELIELLDKSREIVVTEETLHEQRVSFAFGNAMNVESITKDSVRSSSLSIRLRAQL